MKSMRLNRKRFAVFAYVFLFTSALTACGGGGGGDIGTGTASEAPVAIADSGTVAEGGSTNIDLAANDTDPDSELDITSITVVTAPANGTVVVNADGTVDYTHNGSETTSDSFTYSISDAGGVTSIAATVTLTVTPVNDTPVANDDSETTGEGGSISINLVANDVDPENDFDLASIIIDTGTLNGTVAINTDGSVDYSHNGGESASDSFTYTIADNEGARSGIASVNITITLGNDQPVAFPDSGTVAEGGSVNINLAGNDVDAEGALDAGSIAIFADPDSGTVVVNSDGSVDYTHDGSETSSDSFTYTIEDILNATSNTAIVTITVTPVNDAPVAVDDVASVAEGGAVSIDLAANDTDPDDTDPENTLDPGSIVIISSPANGFIDINTDGTVDYTHNGGETTSDSFTYSIKDAELESNIATVTLTVTPVNDAPVASNDTISVNQGGVSVNLPLAVNDTDAEDKLDLTSITIVSGPAIGSLGTPNADGTVDYTPPAGSAATSDSFTYTINDASDVPSTSNTATVTLALLVGFNEALYASPAASSATQPRRVFQANDGVTGDANNGWVTANGDSAPRLTLTFDSPRSIYRVTLSDLLNPASPVTSATLTFSNGDQIAVDALPDNGTAASFVFAPKLVTFVSVSLNAANGIGLSEFSAFSGLEPGQTIDKVDLLKDAAAIAADWVLVDDCGDGMGSSPDWNVVSNNDINNEFQQTGQCRGFDAMEGVELGTYQVLNDGFLVKDMDLRLRLKSTDTSVAPGAGFWVNGAIGILFAHREPNTGGANANNDYYRLDISEAEGHIKLSKKVAGVFTELNSSPQSFTRDSWFNVRIVRQNGVIVVYKDSVKVMAVEDNETVLNNNNHNDGYRVALFCARNESCSFEKLTVLSPPSLPIVGANIVDGAGHASGEYYVDTAGSLEVVAVVTDDTDVTEVEFIIDEGEGGEISFIDAGGAPYTATFGLLTEGNHSVRTYLRDASGRLGNAGAEEELPQVGVSGIHLVGIGDSITGGLKDDLIADDISADGRNTGGGYQPVLNDLLTAANDGTPVTVLDEGNAGETSAEGADRIVAVLARTPAAQGYLAIYGTNDSSGGSPVPSGTGLTCTDPLTLTGCPAAYLGSFKHNMQRIINAVRDAGKTIILGKAPPNLINDSRDALVTEYNTVIDELMAENVIFTGYTAPDFQAYFKANPTEMKDDGLHPNGVGYSRMADGWCKTLNGRELPLKGVISCTEDSVFPN